MDFVKGILPYIKVPALSDTSISNAFCGCIPCYPFGKINQRTVGSSSKPSQEVTTISSLMDKLKADVHQKRKKAENVVIGLHHRTTGQSSFNLKKNLHGKCGRQLSFNYEMKHEKFTPCEVNRQFNGCTRPAPCEGGFTNFPFCGDRISNDVIIAPPRRKRRSRRLLSESSTDCSLDSVINREIWNNSRNLELNKNMDRDLIISTNYRNYNQNSVKYSHKVNNNNKSGCSSIEVDSDSVDVNKTHFMQLDSSRVDNITNNREEAIITFCENKVYYKNCETDEYGNYSNGSDVDEVIVCESIINVQPPTKLAPDDSTYTRLYSDSLYKPHEQKDSRTSSPSFDANFERIVRLKSDTNLQFRSPFQRFKVKRQTKQEERHVCQDFNGIIPVHRPVNESSGCIKPFAKVTRNRGGDSNWISENGTQMQNSGCIRI